MKFIRQNLERPITKDNVEDITGYSLEMLLSLMGLAVISEYKEVFYIEGIYPLLQISVRIPDLSCEISRIFRFDERTIVNQYFEIENPELRSRQIGTKIFCSQVYQARKEGFDRLIIWATGNHEQILHWNGYITWAKLGYTLSEESRIKFIQCMNKLNREESSLKELLSTKEGEKIWIENGFSWDGEFLLDTNSENSKNLREYLKRKGLAGMIGYKE